MDSYTMIGAKLMLQQKKDFMDKAKEESKVNNRPYPGLDEEKTAIMKQRGLKRCGKCEACRFVEDSKRFLMPNPPFSHATDSFVITWNRILFDHPCKETDHVA